MSSVALISAFGRGNWLAAELQANGFEVHLLDVSEHLGRWTPEDREGPFGFYHVESLRASQLERLVEEDHLDEVHQGLCFLFDKGPLELKSPLNSFWLDKLEVAPEIRDYIYSFEKYTDDDIQKFKSGMGEKNFCETWFLNLAHQLSSNVYKENVNAYTYGSPTPCFSTLSLRRVSRRGYEKSLDWCEVKGVNVYRKTQLRDMSVDKKKCLHLEYQAITSGALSCDDYIWLLGSEESHFLSPKISQQLYLSGEMKSEWNWTRFRFDFSEGDFLKSLPKYFVVLQNINLPWTHENLCIVQQTVKDSSFDLWVRVPSIHRFQKQYLEDLGMKLTRLVSKRIPGSDPKLLDPPQEYLYNYKELGPSVFPVYNDKEFEKFKATSLKNLFFNGPENWSQYSWSSMFKSQEKILTKFISKKEKQMNEQRAHQEGARS